MAGASGSLGSLWVEIGAKIDNFKKGMSEAQKALDDALEAMKKTGKGSDPFEDLPKKSKKPIDEVAEAFKQLGITSSAELQKTANASKAAYDTLSKSGKASAGDIQAAFNKMQADELAAIKATTGAMSSQLQTFSSDVDKAMKDAESKFGVFNTLGSKLTGAGVGLTAAITAPILGIGIAATKASGDFDSAMRLVSARGDITGGDLKTLQTQAEELGAKTQFSSKQAAEGMAELAGAGFDTKQIYAAMPGIMNLAAAATTDVGTASKVTKDILGQFGLQASDTQETVDILTKAGNMSSGSLLEMANSLKYVGPPATAAGLSLRDTSAALVALDKAGIRSEQAGTSFRSMLQSLQAPTEKATQALVQYKINLQDTEGNLLPFPQILDNLKQGLTGVSGKAEQAAVLQKIFGENAVTAAQALLRQGGPALRDFGAQLEKVTGESQRTAEVMNSGMGGALERMSGSLETAAQKIGDTFAPLIVSLAGYIEAAANKVAVFAEGFTHLPVPVQLTAGAFIALFAAIGPALLIAGQFASMVVNINQALPIASKGLELLTKWTGLSTLALTAWAAAATVGLIAIGYLIVKYNEWQQAEEEKKRATEGHMNALNQLERYLISQGVNIDNLRAQYRQGEISLDAYEKKLRDVGKALGDSKKGHKDAEGALSDEEKVRKKLEAAVAKTEAMLKAEEKAQKSATAERTKAIKEQEKHQTGSELWPAIVERMVAAHEKEKKELLEWQAAHKTAESRTVKLTEVTLELNMEIQRLVSSAKLMAPAFLDASKQVTDAMAKIPKPIEDIEAVYKRMGITSSETLRKTADQSKADYMRIAETAGRSLGDVNAAWVKMEKDRQAVTLASMGVITEAEKTKLKAMEDALSGHTDKQKEKWGDFSKQVSTIITDTGKNIVERFQKVFAGNDKLDEESAKLKESLGEREEQYGAFADDIAGQMEEARSTYADTLAKEEEQLSESLAKREKDYLEFSDEVEDKIGELREKHAKEAEKERKDLLDQLDDRNQDYDDYVEDVGKNVDEIRSDTKKSIAKETKDLQASLADKTKDYNRYVEDVNAKLVKIREKNKGVQSEEEQDLLKSLARRTEDFEEYKNENAEKLQEFTNEHNAQAAKQEADQLASLARKTRDHEQYKADIETKLEAVTTKHQEELTKEEKDLTDSLAKKKQDYEDYKVEVAGKMEDVRVEALAKLNKQESDLQDKLDIAKKKWEDYRDDVKGKLQEIEDKHLGIFGTIGTVAAGIFTDMGTALGRFVSEQLVGSLFKEFGTLVATILPGIDSALGGIFTKMGGKVAEKVGEKAVDTTADVATKTAGGGISDVIGGAIGSSLTGIVTAVASVATAISSIVGNFQMAAMNKSLDLIENYTRYLKIGLVEQGDSLLNDSHIIRNMATNADHNYWGTTSPFFQDVMGKLEKLGGVDFKLGEINDKMRFAQIRLDAIGADTAAMRAVQERDTFTSMLDQLKLIAQKDLVVNVNVGSQQASTTTNVKLNGIPTV